jgi:hypothetical protein
MRKGGAEREMITLSLNLETDVTTVAIAVLLIVAGGPHRLSTSNRHLCVLIKVKSNTHSR